MNLKKSYSEFLGFKLKAVRKGKKYVVRPHMTDKAVKRVTEKLKEQVRKIAHGKTKNDEILQIKQYNSMIMGIHNYYRYATNVNLDCIKIQFSVYTVMYHQLRGQLKKNGFIQRNVILKNYGKSRMVRYMHQEPICPIGYIQTRNPMYKKRKICKYTTEGREEIHKSLKFDESVMTVLHMIAKEVIPNRSIEYWDNRVSLYAAQYGKCAVTGRILWIDEIHCHHKKPTSQGGTDEYNNLVIVHKDVHMLIHAVKPETIQAYLYKVNPNNSQLDKINKFRILAGNPAI